MISLFKKILQNLVKLLVKQIPIDVSILFKDMENTTQFEQAQETYSSVEEKQLFQEYKSPKCNKFCVGLMKPRASFALQDKDTLYAGAARLHVTNVEKIDLTC